jgi:CBS-domain-containing membrane protein
MMTQFATLTPDAHVEGAVQTLLRTSRSEFPVIDVAGKPVACPARNDLIRALEGAPPRRPRGRRDVDHGAEI